MAKKRGKFSKDEGNFIQRNVHSMSVEDIATQLKRNESTITKYIREHHLARESDVDSHARKMLLNKLHSRDYWINMQDQLLNDKEIREFESTWVNMMMQFQEDMTFSEELDLKQYIMLHILNNRVMQQRYGHQKRIDEVEKELEELKKEPEELRDMVQTESRERILEAMRSSLPNFTIEQDKLLNRIDRLRKDLKASRDARVKRIEDGKTTWKGMLTMLEDESVRAQLSREAELMRMAKDKSKAKLGENHEYVDGTVDRPLNSEDTVTKDDFN